MCLEKDCIAENGTDAFPGLNGNYAQMRVPVLKVNTHVCVIRSEWVKVYVVSSLLVVPRNLLLPGNVRCDHLLPGRFGMDYVGGTNLAPGTNLV